MKQSPRSNENFINSNNDAKFDNQNCDLPPLIANIDTKIVTEKLNDSVVPPPMPIINPPPRQNSVLSILKSKSQFQPTTSTFSSPSNVNINSSHPSLFVHTVSNSSVTISQSNSSKASENSPHIRVPPRVSSNIDNLRREMFSGRINIVGLKAPPADAIVMNTSTGNLESSSAPGSNTNLPLNLRGQTSLTPITSAQVVRRYLQNNRTRSRPQSTLSASPASVQLQSRRRISLRDIQRMPKNQLRQKLLFRQIKRLNEKIGCRKTEIRHIKSVTEHFAKMGVLFELLNGDFDQQFHNITGQWNERKLQVKEYQRISENEQTNDFD